LPFDTAGGLGAIKLAAAVGLAYFAAARLGLVLRAEDLGVFWPAAGIAVGALITLGPGAWLPVSAGVMLATAAANVMVGRDIWLATAFGFLNAGQAILTAWLIERWFGRAFKLDDVRQVLGFLGASAVGAASAALASAVAIGFTQATSSPLNVWRIWFAACLLGTVTVAPLLVGIREAMFVKPARRELIEGAMALITLATLSVFLIFLPRGPWESALPVALVFPVLLWVGVRCRPLFAAAAAFVVALAIICSTASNLGHFGDASIPLADRILAAQTHVLAAALLALVLAALFAEMRRSESALAESRERLQLALDGAELGVWSVDTRTGRLECDARDLRIHRCQAETPPATLTEARRLVHPDDLATLDAAFVASKHNGGNYKAEYRLAPEHGAKPGAQERWVALEGTVVRDAKGRSVRLLGITRDVTARKRAEDTLRKNEQALRELLGALPAAIFVTDADGRITYCNQAAVELWGKRPELGTDRWCDLARFYCADGKPANLRDCPTEIALRRGKSVRGCEAILERADGTRISILPYPTPLFDAAGSIVGVVNMTVDISERKQAEFALAERNAQLALAGQAALVGSYAYEVGMERTQISEGYAAIYGLPEGTTETTRSQWRARVHPDDVQRADGLRARTFNYKQGTFNVEYRIIRSGAVRWIESRGFVSYDEDKRPRRIVGINIDVTERKQTETLLRESEARLQEALTAGKVMAFDWDAGTGRSQRSDNADRIIGGVEDGRFLKHVHAEDRAYFKAHIGGLCPDTPAYALIFRFVRADGQQIWLEETAKGEFDGTGKLLRIKGLTRDITERKELEDHKNTLISELDHRVKNVLALVSTVASRTQETSSSMAEFVAALDGRIKSMATAHELLSHRRWQGIPLAELVRHELAPYATVSNTRIDGPDVVLSAEAGQTLAMVLHELVTNAAKFGAISTKSGRICVRWRFRRNGHAESWLCIHWEESGGPRVVPPTRSGFGTSVVHELIPYELDGRVDLMHSAEGVRAKLEIPARWLIAGKPPGQRGANAQRAARPAR
jgi:PAS domain S-box-containing protein